MALRLVSRIADRAIIGVSEALFPENDRGMPNFREARVVERTWQHLGRLPPEQRRLLLALYVFVELSTVVLARGFRTFSSLPLERRVDTVRHFRSSRVPFLRLVGDGLKATGTLIYLSHPAAMGALGMEGRTCCKS